MTYPLVKFVDGPSAGATVRLDLNDTTASAPRGVESDFDLGVPTLEGDPDAVGQVFGFRSPRFTVQVKGSKANALAFVSALSKELLRRTNWVMFQLNATTSPVWFRTYRVGYQPLSLEEVYGTPAGGAAPAGFNDRWRVEVPLVAEPFVYGARVTIPAVQIVQAPADLAGPTRYAMHYTLPAIKGDAPTPLRVSITPTIADANRNAAWLVGCVNGTTAVIDLIGDIGTGDGAIAGTGMGAPVVDATYFGGSYRTITIGAATPNLLNRFGLTLGGPPGTLPAGRYKVQLRCAYNAGVAKTLVFRVQPFLNGFSGTAPTNFRSVSVPVLGTDTGRRFWVDVGEVNAPFGVTPPSDAGVTNPPLTLGFDIGTGDGSASSVNVDAVRLIPVDGPQVASATFLRHSAPQALGFPLAGTFDGDSEQFWFNNGGLGGITYESVSTLKGGYPVADPAAAKNLLIIQALDSGEASVSGGTYITTLNQLATVGVSYCPRYLHVGDGT